MFQKKDKVRPLTRAEEERQRAAEGRDRRALGQVVVAMIIIFGGLGLLVAADAAWLERKITKATVVGFIDRVYKKGGHECVTQLWTGFGDAKIYTRDFCHDAPWRVGDSAEVEARMLRLTGTVVIETQGTIFNGAYSVLPSS